MDVSTGDKGTVLKKYLMLEKGGEKSYVKWKTSIYRVKLEVF